MIELDPNNPPLQKTMDKKAFGEILVKVFQYSVEDILQLILNDPFSITRRSLVDEILRQTIKSRFRIKVKNNQFELIIYNPTEEEKQAFA